MANNQLGNTLLVDDSSSQVNVARQNLRLLGVMLNNASPAADVSLTISNYSASSPTKIIKFKIDSTISSKFFDLSSAKINFPDGISIPSGGLTSGAEATVIFEGNE